MKQLTLLSGLVLFAGSTSVWAGAAQPVVISAEDWAAMQEQIDQNTLALEKSDWTQRIKIVGDLRYRYQNDDVSGADGSTRDRDRQRIRARPAIIAQVNKDVEVGFGLATGSDDPVSSNQTIGDFGSSKNINLDLAYFDWKAATGLIVGGGKFKNPMFQPGKSAMQWDSDFRPEGLNVRYKNGQWFVNSAVSWAESENDTIDGVSDDSTLYGALVQTGLQTELAGAEVIVGIGYSQWNSGGKFCFEGDSCGSNATIADLYVFDHEVIDVFAEGKVKVGEQPLKFWAQFIQNGDADGTFSSDGDSQDTGVQVGAQLGKAKDPGTWQAKVYYQDLEDNATLDFLTNSDFAGGGTGTEGWYVGGKYALNKATTLGFSYYFGERTDPDPFEEVDVDTLQIDLVFKYK